MTEIKSSTIAGMSMKGGRNDNFYFCLLQYFPDSKRWFLHSLLKVQDEKGLESEEAIRSWINRYKLKQLVVDFPLSKPACHDCLVDCPGDKICVDHNVKEIRSKISKILIDDKKIYSDSPKGYERNRNKDDEFDINKNLLDKNANDHLLSRSFKRKLKKGYLPYWNRPIDFWVWSQYHDQLLEFFNISYDSYGNTSLMIQSRFDYLKRHFPSDLELFEGNTSIALIELLKANIISKRDLINLKDFEVHAEARLDIIKSIEKGLNIFVYDNDLEILVKNPHAFDSFLLSVIGQNISTQENSNLPEWVNPDYCRFAAASF